MTEWKEHTILTMCSKVNTDVDEMFWDALQRIFEWANRMGKEGKSVSGFYIEKEPVSCNPFKDYKKIKCNVKKDD